MSETLTLGLTLTTPSAGERNWDQSFLNNFATPISQHKHTGSGDGAQLVTNSFAANAVTGAKFRLDNNEYLRARNNADSADVNLIRLSTSDELQLGTTLYTVNVDVQTDDTYNFGSSSTRIAEFWVHKIRSFGTLEIGTNNANLVELFVNDSVKWSLDNLTYEFFPASTYNVGKAANPVGTLFTNSIDFRGTTSGSAGSLVGYLELEVAGTTRKIPYYAVS